GLVLAVDLPPEHPMPFTMAPDGSHVLRMCEAEAAVVRRIFEEYAAGDGMRAIVRRLNAERVPSPPGGGWAGTAVRKLLQNEVYIGRRHWNRTERIKDSESGKRVAHSRGRSEWVVAEDEAWRIVPQPLWEAAQALREQRAAMYQRTPDGRRIAGPRPGGGHRG